MKIIFLQGFSRKIQISNLFHMGGQTEKNITKLIDVCTFAKGPRNKDSQINSDKNREGGVVWALVWVR